MGYWVLLIFSIQRMFLEGGGGGGGGGGGRQISFENNDIAHSISVDDNSRIFTHLRIYFKEQNAMSLYNQSYCNEIKKNYVDT